MKSLCVLCNVEIIYTHACARAYNVVSFYPLKGKFFTPHCEIYFGAK